MTQARDDAGLDGSTAENFNGAHGIQAPEPKALIPLLHTAAHQNLASKMFCFCCKDCEEPDGIDDSRTPSQSQEFQPLKHGRYQAKTPSLASQDFILLIPSCLQKDELDGQNPKHGDTVSRKPLGQPLIEPGKRASYNGGSEFEDVNSHVSKRGFYKRNLNCYFQGHWPYQPCLIGRP
ncbi:testis-expressed protein 48 [Camelus bactrianus]|uniref:Testis-expressed protein 48 n=1 Tax=Camelus bactrianus TaxID=9837 RepID=A0AC58QAH7_CAMBA